MKLLSEKLTTEQSWTPVVRKSTESAAAHLRALRFQLYPKNRTAKVIDTAQVLEKGIVQDNSVVIVRTPICRPNTIDDVLAGNQFAKLSLPDEPVVEDVDNGIFVRRQPPPPPPLLPPVKISKNLKDPASPKSTKSANTQSVVVGQQMSDGTRKPKTVTMPTDTEKKEDEPDIYYLVRPPRHLPQYAVSPDHEIILLPVHDDYYAKYLIIEHGSTVADVKSHGYGWVTTNVKCVNNTVIAASAIDEKIIQFYKWGPVAYPQQQYIVLMPGLTIINDLVSGSVKTYLQATVTAKLHKKYPNCPDTLIISTSQYFTNRIHYLECMAQNQGPEVRRTTNNNESLGVCDAIVARAASHVGVLMTDGLPSILPSQECTVDAAYPLRWDVCIGDRCGVVNHSTKNKILTVGRTNYKVIDSVPAFAQKSTHVNRQYRTRFLSYVGTNVEPFVEYEQSSINFNLALKRMLSARKGEIHYRKNSRMLTEKVLQQLTWLGKSRLSSRMKKMYHHCYYASNERDNDLFHYHTSRHDDILHNPHPDLTRDVILDTREQASLAIAKLIMSCKRERVQAFVDKLRTSAHWAYYKGFEAYLTNFEAFLSRENNASIPHVKRALRTAYVNGIKLHDDADNMTRRLNAAVKRELAKYGKVPRLFVSYDAGCMYANELPEYVKVALDGEWGSSYYGVSVLTYIVGKPRTGLLTELFRKMHESLGVTDYIYIVIYSDDSVICGQVGGSSFGFNVDVTSNDSSQDASAFIGVYGCLSNFHKHRAEELIKQCMKPIYCINPDDRDDFYTLQFDKPFEGSGTSITKILNDVASFCNLQCAAYLIARFKTPHMFETYVSWGAFVAGHVVTCEVAGEVGSVVVEKLQFLKHSPMYGLDGLLYSVPNSGPKLRGFGSIRQDLEPVHCGVDSTTFSQLNSWDRCEIVTSAVVTSWKNDPSDPITAAFRERYSRGATPTQVEAIIMRNDSGLVANLDVDIPLDLHEVVINPVSYCTRYDLLSSDLDELLALVRESVVGQQIPSRAVGHIYSTDYGFPLL